MKELLLEEHMECGCQEREKYRSLQDLPFESLHD
jgi:hypothetical protein